MKYIYYIILASILTSCNITPSSDKVQQQQQEKILAEATAQVGMPSIVNFREKKLLKDIIEMRDQEALTTYTYLFAENTGKLVFVGESIGYGIPTSTQFTSPEKVEMRAGNIVTLPQADPNGLFSHASADGTWVMMKDPRSKNVLPVFFEPRVIVSPFPIQ